MNGRACILYRWWDSEGNLLYIGKSVSVLARISSHSRYSKFFDEAASMTIERFPDEIALGFAEVAAIRAERPPYNIVHNREVEMSEEESLSPEMHDEMCLAMEAVLAPTLNRLPLEVLSG